MISSTAASTGSPRSGPGWLDSRGLRAPTPRRSRPRRSPEGGGRASSRAALSRELLPFLPRHRRPYSARSVSTPQRLPISDEACLILPNTHPWVRTHRCRFLQNGQFAAAHGGGEALAPAAAESASGYKRPLFQQAGAGQVKECVEEGQPRGSKGVPRPYQHWRWKAAGQWSQHRRSPPSLQLSQLSWLVALPLLRGSFSGFRLRFSASSDLGGASRAWICCTHIQTACVHTRSSRAVRRPTGAASPSPTPLPPFVLLPPIQAAPRTSQPP